MQTFLPYPDFRRSLECLDTRRLGKQRVEAMQLLNAAQRTTGGWIRHPAQLMWAGHEEALRLYHNLAIEVWAVRGFRNTMTLFGIGRASCRERVCQYGLVSVGAVSLKNNK